MPKTPKTKLSLTKTILKIVEWYLELPDEIDSLATEHETSNISELQLQTTTAGSNKCKTEPEEITSTQGLILNHNGKNSESCERMGEISYTDNTGVSNHKFLSKNEAIESFRIFGLTEETRYSSNRQEFTSKTKHSEKDFIQVFRPWSQEQIPAVKNQSVTSSYHELYLFDSSTGPVKFGTYASSNHNMSHSESESVKNLDHVTKWLSEQDTRRKSITLADSHEISMSDSPTNRSVTSMTGQNLNESESLSSQITSRLSTEPISRTESPAMSINNHEYSLLELPTNGVKASNLHKMRDFESQPEKDVNQEYSCIWPEQVSRARNSFMSTNDPDFSLSDPSKEDFEVVETSNYQNMCKFESQSRFDLNNAKRLKPEPISPVSQSSYITRRLSTELISRTESSARSTNKQESLLESPTNRIEVSNHHRMVDFESKSEKDCNHYNCLRPEQVSRARNSSMSTNDHDFSLSDPSKHDSGIVETAETSNYQNMCKFESQARLDLNKAIKHSTSEPISPIEDPSSDSEIDVNVSDSDVTNLDSLLSNPEPEDLMTEKQRKDFNDTRYELAAIINAINDLLFEMKGNFSWLRVFNIVNIPCRYDYKRHDDKLYNLQSKIIEVWPMLRTTLESVKECLKDSLALFTILFRRDAYVNIKKLKNKFKMSEHLNKGIKLLERMPLSNITNFNSRFLITFRKSIICTFERFIKVHKKFYWVYLDILKEVFYSIPKDYF